MQATKECILETLEHWANVQPDKLVHSFINGDLEVIDSLTYLQLKLLACNLAQNLLSNHGLRQGDRVLLVYLPSLDFIVAFYACLYAQLIAVPVFPPDPSRLKKDIVLFSSVASSCSAVAALTSRSYDFATKIATIKSMFGEAINWPGNLQWIIADRPSIAQLDLDYSMLTVHANPDSVAFLQYTSGSTSEPKGVMISHGNLSHNLSIIVSSLRASTSTIVCSWLPQYHDMGLIGSYLGVIWCGGSGVYMSPLTFIKQPVAWIMAISKFKATHMQAPNFAYSLVARKFLAPSPSSSSSCDLSSVEHMINAAEPVEGETIDRFYQVFCPYGLKRGVIFPTYGLAEHTVFVSSGDNRFDVGRDDFTRLVVDKDALNNEGVVRLVDKHMLWTYSQLETGKGGRDEGTRVCIMSSCGYPSLSDKVDVRIVDHERCIALAEDVVGEIWVRSPSRSVGYWQMDHEDFHGVISGLQDGVDEAAGGCTETTAAGQVSPMKDMKYLKTGDLGFMHDNQLFICGRIKDMIIVGGRNHYPQDIEKSMEECRNIKPGSVAAFGLSSLLLPGLDNDTDCDGEVLAVMAEVRDMDGLDALVTELRSVVAMAHGISPAVVLILGQKSIPKTTSGKIARKNCMKSMITILKGDKGGLISNSSILKLDIIQPIKATTDSRAVTKMDPKVMSLDDILTVILRELKRSMLRQDPGLVDESSIPVDTSVRLLGLDSMTGLELVGKLESIFSVSKVDENYLLGEGTTILMLAEYIKSGGGDMGICQSNEKVSSKRLPPVIVDACKLFCQKSAIYGREQLLKAGIASEMPSNRRHFDKTPLQNLSLLENFAICLITGVVFGSPYLLFISIVTLFLTLPWLTAMCIIAVFSLVSEAACFVSNKWPPPPHASSKLTKWINHAALKYFSYKVIVDTESGWLDSNFTSESDGIIESKSSNQQTVPVIYVASPHGVFPFGHILHITVSKLLFGFDFHGAGADAMFHVPILGHFMRFMGLRSVSKASMISLLCKGRSMGIIPGGISEVFEDRPAGSEVYLLKTRKGFVKVAMEAALKMHLATKQPAMVRLVPCIQFGNSIAMTALSSSQVPVLHHLSRVLRTGLTVFWGRWFLPIPKRIPILGIVGNAVDIIVNDSTLQISQAAIDQYHDRFIREMERMFNAHKRSYGWESVKLIMK